MSGFGFRAGRNKGVSMVEFTKNQLALMDEKDLADIARADRMGFKRPCYLRMMEDATGNVTAQEQPFSPRALRVLTNGVSYPESATPENCERLIALWNAQGRTKYAMV